LRADLPDVTLVAITSVAVAPTISALQESMRQLRFGRVLFLSDQPPAVGTDPGIEWRRIDRLGSRRDYSRFMLRELVGHIETPHVLCIQWDGFVLDGGRWNPAFLNYDYIGAPWPHFRDGCNVGNGGFSLRSRRLLEACTTLPFDETAAEDIVISRLCRPLLVARGMCFAPESIAREFAYERIEATGREFGFHGAFNLMRYLSPQEALRLFRDLEPVVLSRNERWELLRWAVAHGRPMLALILLRRLLA
jgi:hypothetical protein